MRAHPMAAQSVGRMVLWKAALWAARWVDLMVSPKVVGRAAWRVVETGGMWVGQTAAALDIRWV